LLIDGVFLQTTSSTNDDFALNGNDSAELDLVGRIFE